MEPTLSLAFSMHANRGLYALLLGSGVSRKAQIPTGWEIVENLIRKVAAAQNEDCGPDPDKWYKAKFGEEAGYSSLLERLGRSPADRREILRGYFEPNDEELQDGVKQPTEAHRAIARLMRAGYVRLVLTTNFDRLLELALEDEGVRPAVIDTVDKAEGARPLVHLPSTVVKVHGDYLDDRMKNTLAELSAYDPPVDRLLDRILDEYGLVVCGWSGDWDPALRAALERCSSRRFSSYWTSLGKPSSAAQRLINHREAVEIQISGADEFFLDLYEKVEALESHGRHHPVSTSVAVSLLEKYLESDEHRIKLHRLVTQETERVFALAANVAGFGDIEPVIKERELWSRKLLEESDTLIRLVRTGCYWGEGRCDQLWVQSLSRLMEAKMRHRRGYVAWSDLSSYPALLAFYAGGIASYARGRMETLASLCHAKVPGGGRTSESAFEVLNMNLMLPCRLLTQGDQEEGGNDESEPSDYMFRTLRPYFLELLPSDREFEMAFGGFEFILSFSVGMTRGVEMSPHGRFARQGRDGATSVLDELGVEISRLAADWPPLKHGVVPWDGRSIVEFKNEFVKRHGGTIEPRSLFGSGDR